MNNMIIKREALVESFLKSMQGGHLLLTGVPGVGKSWLIMKALSKLKEKNIPAIFLKADSMDVNAISDFRTFLGIHTTIEQFFNYKSGGQRSVLIIDALDAARSQTKQLAYRDFMRYVQEKCANWVIVASIRVYDAKHSKELLSLFPKMNLAVENCFQNKEIPYRHIYIPPLTEKEIFEGLTQSSKLKRIYEAASIELKELFRIPFNIWLMNQLAEEQIADEEISNVRTVIELFNLYWEYRIYKKDDYVDRIAILKKVTSYMVNNHTLSINRSNAILDNTTNAFKGLLSDKILTPLTSSEDTLGFGHNILFDYAVSRLLMEESGEKVFKFITTEISRAIFLRPSINYYFGRLWYGDNELFWKIFWYFQGKHEKEYVSILPVFTVATEVKSCEDFASVFNHKNSLASNKIDVYFETINRILKVLEISKSKIKESDSCWVEIFLILSKGISLKFLDSYMRLLKRFLDASSIWNTEIYSKIAETARNIFRWGWDNENGLIDLQKTRVKETISFWIIPLICRTYQTDPKASREALSIIIDNVGPHSVIRAIYSLSQEVETVWIHDPDFAVNIYKKIFEYEEMSNEPTQMRGGVLALTSNKKQDYEGCYYLLVEKMSNFLTQKPIYAVKAIIETIEVLANREKLSNGYAGYQCLFDFDGKEARYMTDGSSVWDDRDYSRDEHVKLLKKFLDYLLNLGKNNQVDILAQILDVIVKRNTLAVIWKYILKATIHYPQIFIPHVIPVLTARPIIALPDTSYVYGNFLNKCYGVLDDQTRKIIEEVILSLKETDFDYERDYETIDKKRKRLISQISLDLLVTDGAKKIKEEMDRNKEAVDNEPPFKIGEWSSKPYTERDWLKEKGVNIDEDDNKSLLAISDLVKKFCEDNLNKIPAQDEFYENWNNILALKNALATNNKNYSERVIEVSLTHLASACEKILRNDILNQKSNVLNTCEEILHIAGNSKYPEYDPEYHKEFDSLHWSPAPRIEAAEGIMVLVRNENFASEKNKELIKKLSSDMVPAVRYHIIRRLMMMYKTANKEMWEIILETANNEKTNGVLATLSASLVSIAGLETDRVLDVYEIIASRQKLKDRQKAGAHNDPIVSTITQLYIFYSNVRASKKIECYEKAPLEFYDELSQVAITAINYLVIKDKTKFKDSPENIKARTHDIIARVLEAARKGLIAIQEEKISDEKRSELIREIYHPIEIISRWFYFNTDSKNKGQILTGEELKVYYYEIKPLIEKIINIGFEIKFLSPTTTHHLVELSNRVLSIDPKGVIKIIDDLCSIPSGYIFDSFALREITNLVEIAIVDHKEALREEATMNYLMNIIDTFVKAGWHEAIELAMRLDEIWR